MTYITKPIEKAKPFSLTTKENEFDKDMENAISGEELVNRLTKRIYQMFDYDNKVSSTSRAVSV